MKNSATILAVVVCVTFAAGQAQAELIAHWQFEEASGTLYDASDNDNDGSYNGSLYQQPGQIGYGLGFDGNDYVDCGNVLDVADKLTVTAWVKNSGNSHGNVVGKYQSQSQRWHIYVNDGADNKIYWNIGGQNWGFSPASDIGTDWHHLAMVYDGTQSGNENRLKAYVDGESVNLTFAGTIPDLMPDISANLNIGRHGAGNFFSGTIDDVGVWDEALSQSEIQNTMTGGVPEPATLTLLGLGGLGMLLRRYRRLARE